MQTNDEGGGASADRFAEGRDLDIALRAMGTKFTPGYAIRLSVLESAICDYVDGLRSDDVGPAQVLIDFKEHLAAAATSSIDIDRFAISRCIARYYE